MSSGVDALARQPAQSTSSDEPMEPQQLTILHRKTTPHLKGCGCIAEQRDMCRAFAAFDRQVNFQGRHVHISGGLPGSGHCPGHD